jgi:beta-mannosidase
MIASLIRYPLARFISEHGFQSFPSFESYAPVTAPEDHSRDSWLLFYRQRHQLGNEQVEKMIAYDCI